MSIPVIVVSALATLAFVGTFLASGLIRHGWAVLRISREAVVSLSDPALDDLAKERLARRHAARLLQLFLVILLWCILLLASPLAVIHVAEMLAIIPSDAVFGLMFGWEFILASTALVCVGIWTVRVR